MPPLWLWCVSLTRRRFITQLIYHFFISMHTCAAIFLSRIFIHIFFFGFRCNNFLYMLACLTNSLSFNDSLAYFFHFITLIWVHCAPIKYSFAFVAFNSELFYFIFFGWHKKKEITRDISKKEWEIQFRLKKWAVN